MKTCTKCSQHLPLTSYYKDVSKRDKLHSQCRDCHIARHRRRREDPKEVARDRAANKKWREANPERSRAAIRNANLRKKYGIDSEQYNLLLEKQQGKCAICDSTSSKVEGQTRLHVDHCHTTGLVRGLLCQACNVTLGKMQESPELLRKAANYLEYNLSKF